jgi:hypothetical protein
MTFSDFFSSFGDLDWVAILVGTVALMVLGFLWYGPLFGKKWAAARGIPYNAGSAAGMGGPVAMTAVYLLVFNIGVAYMAPFDDIEAALVMGVIAGVFLIGAALYSSVVWAKQSNTVFVIDLTHWFVAIAVAFYVQGLRA